MVSGEKDRGNGEDEEGAERLPSYCCVSPDEHTTRAQSYGEAMEKRLLNESEDIEEPNSAEHIRGNEEADAEGEEVETEKRLTADGRPTPIKASDVVNRQGRKGGYEKMKRLLSHNKERNAHSNEEKGLAEESLPSPFNEK